MPNSANAVETPISFGPTDTQAFVWAINSGYILSGIQAIPSDINGIISALAADVTINVYVNGTLEESLTVTNGQAVPFFQAIAPTRSLVQNDVISVQVSVAPGTGRYLGVTLIGRS